MINGPSACYLANADNFTLDLHYEIEIFSPALGFPFPASFVDGKVTFSNINGPIRIKNTDLNSTTSQVDGANLTVHSPTIHISDSQLEGMTSYIMSTGKIPNGTYVFKFSVKSPGNCNSTIDSFSRDVEIYEPTFLDLLTPGYNNFSDASESPVYSSYPVFTWNSDICSGCNYKIRVCEYDEIYHSSYSEALNDISVLPINSDDYFPIDSDGFVFQYPSSGAFDLESGKNYVWQIMRDYGTTVGVKEDYSDIFIFKISSFQNYNSSNIDFIKEIIGEENFSNLFGPGGELEGFLLSGIMLNDQPSSLQGIQEIILDIQQGGLSVEEYSID